MSIRVFIVADDLTGAMDVAGPLADRGLPTLAVASREGCSRADLDGGTVVSVNADSRHMSATDATRCMQRISRDLIGEGVEILIKKIDSTLRGNVVAETLAMLDGTGRGIAVIAPAFPGQKRTMREGMVHVEGVPLPETQFARDALSPPPLTPLHLLFTRTAPDAVVQLVRSGQTPSLATGARRQIFVCDSESDRDLEQVVRRLQPDLARVLFVGSAGIAQALGRVCFGSEQAAVSLPPVSGRLLFVVGSRAQQSAEQVRRLQVAGAQVFAAPEGAVPVEQVVGAQAGVVVVQATARADGQAGDAVEVARRLGEGVSAVLARGGVGALVATGGDTAIAILRKLGQPTVRVHGTLLPGIPCSRIGVAGREVAFVTKAGGFGAADTFTLIASRLRAG
jgi:uncharacterized protein YgbK (DUF1537 family)